MCLPSSLLLLCLFRSCSGRVEVTRDKGRHLILHTSTGSSCYFFCFPVLACPLTCQNGGTLSGSTCTCDCTDGYRGDDCESEYITCGCLDPVSTGGHRAYAVSGVYMPIHHVGVAQGLPIDTGYYYTQFTAQITLSSMVNLCTVVGCSNCSTRESFKKFCFLLAIVSHKGKETSVFSEKWEEVWLSCLC